MEYALFGTASALGLYAVLQLVPDAGNSLRRCLATACLSLSLLLLYFWAVLTGFILHVPAFVNVDISLSFFAAPALYLLFTAFLSEGKKPFERLWPWFLFPVVFAVGFGIYNFFRAPFWFRELGTVPSHFDEPFLLIVSLLADLVMFAFLLAAFLRAIARRRRGAIRHVREYRIFLGFLAVLLATCLMILSSYIFRNDFIMVAGSLLFGATAMTWSLACSILYDYSRAAFLPLTERRRLRLKEWDDEAEDFERRLTLLMEKEALFTDPGLTIGAAAKRLAVPAARLSRHVNTRHGRNFRAWLNDLRIRRAARELADSPERPILEIAFEAGFNSKTSFNTLFAETYGVSPREYREKISAKKGSETRS